MHYNYQGTISLILLSIFLTTSLTRGQLNLTGVNSHVFQLEKAVADLQSQSKIQEQKYSAVLSSVLSKLTTTTDELATLRLEHNATVVQLGVIQRDHNSTIQTLAGLQKDHNNTVVELAAVTDKLVDVQTRTNMSVTQQELDTVKDEMKTFSQQSNASRDLGILKLEMTAMLRNMSDLHSVMLNVSGSSVSNIYFQVTSTASDAVGDGENFRFDTALLNKGEWYETTTGIFEAPESGIYLFWAHIMNKTKMTFSVKLQRDGNLLIEDTTSKQEESANIFHVVKISKGDKVWFTCVGHDGGNNECALSETFGQNESYYGGILLRNN